MPSMTEKFLQLMGELRQTGEDFCVATVVRTADATSAKAGAKAIVTGKGEIHGHIGGGCVQGALRRACAEAIAAGQPRMIRVKPKDQVVAPVDVDGIELHKSSCPSGGTVDIFLEPMRQEPRLVVCGASVVAETLLKLAAAMGTHTVSAALPDDRDKVTAGDATIDGFDLAPLDLGQRDAVVVATQGRRDREALDHALRSGAGYVGMVGSRRKIQALLDGLGEAVPSARKAVLHGPAGLDIGAIDPEEIAASIIAEIVWERRRTMSAASRQPAASVP